MAIGELNPTTGWPMRFLPLPDNRSGSTTPKPTPGPPEKVAVVPGTIGTIIGGLFGKSASTRT